MEESGGQSLDGSSIKPVSSLRSHFEQMANSEPNGHSSTREVSPKPVSHRTSIGEFPKHGMSRLEGENALAEGLRIARGRDLNAASPSALRPLRSEGNPSPSPTRALRPRPISTIAPSVAVHPPHTPPKVKTLNLSISNTPELLSSPVPLSATPRSASPKHFRTSSRPQTPSLGPSRSQSLSPSQPPSPPPPRRSGEFRRDASFRIPPPVKRAEKPQIPKKPSTLGPDTESKGLMPASISASKEKTSPFSSPPSSDSSPDHEPVAPPLPPNRPQVNVDSMLPPPQMNFERPPVHYSVANKRMAQETNGFVKSPISPQITGDRKPTLPMRPSEAIRNPKPRPLSQTISTRPPPLRTSLDRSRSTLVTSRAEAMPLVVNPPKRVVSTPTSQPQAQSRSHGRSMTIDRTSEKTPVEFRASSGFSGPPRTSTEVAPSTSIINDTARSGQSEYPDSSRSNRRPPNFKTGPREIPTKYDTRIFDVYGEYVCTSGQSTRVWTLLDGEQIMTLPHTEGIKIVSLAFKPGSNIQDEGSRLWLGNNIGDIMEVDIRAQNVVASKSNAHTRREIIKIHRHVQEMWTLDDGGTLHLWAPDSSGTPNLTNPHQSFRVPKGHTFSLVAGHQLWHAAGKDLRVFLPTLDGIEKFQVLQRPLCQPGTGDITSGTTLNSQHNRVYFGHSDGKVSIYSRRDYSCLGVINVSMYKITCLAGFRNNLWAGFSTGMIYVYDTTQKPWVVKKDWQAHHDPVIGLIADRSSFWTMDRAQTVSLGLDNMIRAWDGILLDDWIGAHMQSQEATFCDLKPIKALVMTWNAGASTPYHLQHSEEDAAFFRDLIKTSNTPDILVFGFQELIDLEDKKTTAKSFFKSKRKDPSEPEHMSHQYRDWRDFLTRCLGNYMPREELYHELHTASLVGLFTCVFVRAPLRDRIRSVSGAEVKRGMGGLHGNKGALILRFILDDTSLCFINCHLAAGQSQTRDRNNDITLILESSLLPVERDSTIRQDSFVGGGDGSMIMDHEICILNGDLNYRIDTMGRDTVVNAVKANNLAKLLERDQLLASKRKNPWFRLRAFDELPITFAPTYKYDVGTDNYDTSEKKRSPAWCDRVLYRGGDRVKQLDYRRHEVRVSDHRPVTALFDITIKTVSSKKRAMKWEECQRQLKKMKEKVFQESKAEYLLNFLGLDPATSTKLLEQNIR
ncbi:hypothetical protein B7463_g4804, partial [Scytalidium lignicola]